MSHFEGKDINTTFITAYELYQSGDKKGAIALSEEIYEGAMKYYGPIHGQVVNALENLIVYCEGAGEKEKAEKYRKTAYEKSCQAFGPDDVRTKKFR